MEKLETVGRTIYPGLRLNLVVRDDLDTTFLRGSSVLQLMFVQEGSVMVRRPGEDLRLNPPLLLCLDHGKPSDHLEIEDGKGFSVIFRPDVVNHSMGSSGLGEEGDRSFKLNEVLIDPFRQSTQDNPVFLQADPALQRRILSIKANLAAQIEKQPDATWPCRGRSFFLELMILLQSFLDEGAREAAMFRLPRGSELVRSASRSACLRYPEPRLSLGVIAKEQGVRKAELAKAFRVAGEPFPTFLARLRASVAANLVRNTILPMDVIRERAGYRSMMAMKSAFKKACGMSPDEYRAAHPNPYGAEEAV